MSTQTSRLSLEKPAVGGDTDVWGSLLNGNADILDQALIQNHGSTQSVDAPISFPDGSESAPSVTNTGDTNTGWFWPSADTLAASTGGNERLRIDSGGNLSLGTSTADGRFSLLEGTTGQGISIRTTGNNLAGYIGSNGGATTFAGLVINAHRGNGTITFQTQDNDRAVITNSGDWVHNVNSSAASLTSNGTMTWALTSNTNLRVSARGSDGTTRTADLTLS